MEEVTSDSVFEMFAGETLGERQPKIEVEKGRVVLEVNKLYSSNFLRNISFSSKRGEIIVKS